MNQPLFIIGNKRSGTSQLVRLLNLHPRIFVAHESDIVWILYQFHHNRPFQPHPWDSDRGQKIALNLAGHLLQPKASPLENFQTLLTSIMEQGTPWLPPQHKKNLLWIGDKKPLQHTDPELLPFLLQNFPDAHFIHIVRHPFDVVASSERFNKTADGDFWLNLSPAQKLERWTFHEQLVIQLRESIPDRVFTLRFEDLCLNTESELKRLFEFLNVDAGAALLHEAIRQTIPRARPRPRIPCPPETVAICELYGYDLEFAPGKLRALTQTLRWRLQKRLKATSKHAPRRIRSIR